MLVFGLDAPHAAAVEVFLDVDLGLPLGGLFKSAFSRPNWQAEVDPRERISLIRILRLPISDYPLALPLRLGEPRTLIILRVHQLPILILLRIRAGPRIHILPPSIAHSVQIAEFLQYSINRDACLLSLETLVSGARRRLKKGRVSERVLRAVVSARLLDARPIQVRIEDLQKIRIVHFQDFQTVAFCMLILK